MTIKTLDPLITPVQNILDLIHHTYPLSIDVIDVTNYTFVASAKLDDPVHNSTLTVTSLPTAPTQGTRTQSYNRVDISRTRVQLIEGETVAGRVYTDLQLHEDPTEIIVVPHATDPLVSVVSAVDTSLLYTGTFEISLPVPDINTIIDGDPLDGFVAPPEV